jgi:hypothetical protein
MTFSITWIQAIIAALGVLAAVSLAVSSRRQEARRQQIADAPLLELRGRPPGADAWESFDVVCVTSSPALDVEVEVRHDLAPGQKWRDGYDVLVSIPVLVPGRLWLVSEDLERLRESLDRRDKDAPLVSRKWIEIRSSATGRNGAEVHQWWRLRPGEPAIDAPYVLHSVRIKPSIGKPIEIHVGGRTGRSTVPGGIPWTGPDPHGEHIPDINRLLSTLSAQERQDLVAEGTPAGRYETLVGVMGPRELPKASLTDSVDEIVRKRVKGMEKMSK